ncbi:prepilin-type N-terminal cleavage/methylation domain-containing protein [Psychromonas sp. RZ22]|uniref:prepilin-type N-terminal cleavage/methylation domain-containing protein n=1 Tax=Psychromonas algarum TaxID=2555643 RepID=UPI0010689137|nr:prepilin-type N-terminal cleavage/methylation domain-containing protein [Psychromonas sp. RZ22]TEW55641.1 prepilin-type N-terminal cleavage/methylation domain-containing protein [Psychromonas sp. RZ22]
MHKHKGFTLIELVIVIIILGVLAAVALPKFVSLQSDAKSASLKGLSGAINSASNIVYAKSAIQGVEKAVSGSVENIAVTYGYPNASSANLYLFVDGVESAVADGTWEVYLESPQCTNPDCVVIGYPGEDISSEDGFLASCFVGYFSATEDLPAKSYLMGESCGGLHINDIPHIGS